MTPAAPGSSEVEAASHRLIDSADSNGSRITVSKEALDALIDALVTGRPTDAARAAEVMRPLLRTALEKALRYEHSHPLCDPAMAVDYGMRALALPLPAEPAGEWRTDVENAPRGLKEPRPDLWAFGGQFSRPHLVSSGEEWWRHVGVTHWRHLVRPTPPAPGVGS